MLDVPGADCLKFNGLSRPAEGKALRSRGNQRYVSLKLEEHRNGANSCGDASKGADPVDGQPIARVSRDFNGLRADAPGVIAFKELERSGRKFPQSHRRDFASRALRFALWRFAAGCAHLLSAGRVTSKDPLSSCSAESPRTASSPVRPARAGGPRWWGPGSASTRASTGCWESIISAAAATARRRRSAANFRPSAPMIKPKH